MTKRVYFAHPVIEYDTPREVRALLVIEQRFPGFEIVNPNTPEHEAAYKGRGDFGYWEDLAYSCDVIVFMCMPGPQGLIGSGVAKEVETALLGREVPNGRMPVGEREVYEIYRQTFHLQRVHELSYDRVMTVKETKLVISMLRNWRLELDR